MMQSFRGEGFILKKKKFILTKNDLFKSFYCFPRLSIESEGLLNGLPFCYYY